MCSEKMKKMRYILLPLLGFFMCLGSYAESEIFVPSDDCYPDPVLDSISIGKDNVYVQDHVITSGEMAYVMEKVNPALYTKLRKGRRMYLWGALGTFVGASMMVTGYVWNDNYSDARQDVGRGLMIAGAPVAAASIATFTVGTYKSHKAVQSFKRNCLGIAYARFDVGLGFDNVALRVTW
jgi:hypothetical protein